MSRFNLAVSLVRIPTSFVILSCLLLIVVSTATITHMQSSAKVSKPIGLSTKVQATKPTKSGQSTNTPTTPVPSVAPSASIGSATTSSAVHSTNSVAATSTPKNSTTPSPAVADTNPYGARCLGLLSQYYNAYQADIPVKKAQHEAKLAELQAAYNDGDYADPDEALQDPAQEYSDYQADVQAENGNWLQATTGEASDYNAKLAAAGCAYSV